MTPEDLIAFESDIARRFSNGEVKGPVHLSSGNELQLIEIFKDIDRRDWVFGTYRSHLHALLHGVPADLLREEIIAGHSMNLKFPEHQFFNSAIVGGCLPIAVGVAAAIQRKKENRKVWCFVGDMAASIGAFHDAVQYSMGHGLPIMFVVEDNELSVNTPTRMPWGGLPFQYFNCPRVVRYYYTNGYYHWGVQRGRSF